LRPSSLGQLRSLHHCLRTQEGRVLLLLAKAELDQVHVEMEKIGAPVDFARLQGRAQVLRDLLEIPELKETDFDHAKDPVQGGASEDTGY